MHDLHGDVATMLHVVREIDRRRPAPSQLSRQTVAVDEHAVDVHHAFRLIAGLQLLLIECDAPTLDAGPIRVKCFRNFDSRSGVHRGVMAILP